MSIRSKFLAFTACLLTVISAFVFHYYPKEYKKNVISTLQTQVNSMAEMVALGVGIGRELDNFKVILEALNWAKRDENLIYILLLDESGEEYAAYNPNNHEVEEKTFKFVKGIYEHKDYLTVVVPVIFNGQPYGKLIAGYSLKELHQNISGNQYTTLRVSLAILILGLGLSMVFSRKITVPLYQLTKAAQAITQGENDVKVEVVSSDEVGELAKALKVMLDKIQTSFSEIKKINAEMEITRDQALAASRAKSEFLSRMSHELRTPMNAILGFGQLLSFDSEEPLTESQKVRVDEILNAGNHLLELINEVLDLAKVEAGKVTLSIESVDLQELLEEIHVLLSPMADGQSVTIRNEIDKRPGLTVLADRTRLKQVLLNLITNAIKYNKTGGSCTVHAERKAGSRISIRVSDTGIGIPAEKMDSLFTPFDRLDAENSEIEGTGIGLSITQRLIELMQGGIEVESNLGEGATFTIDLPEGTPIEMPKEKVIRDRREGQPVDPNHSGIKLLYVEDNPANLKLVEQLLSITNKFEVISAPQAEIGIELARAHQPDLILMDINLPGMDGITAFKRLKLSEETRNIPVIALSANAMDSDIQAALKEGFASYITKPIQVDTFLETIHQFILTGKEK